MYHGLASFNPLCVKVFGKIDGRIIMVFFINMIICYVT